MDFYDWLLPLVCILPAALISVTVWGLRRLSMRGFQTAIEMDGATCLKANDGSVVLRRSSGYTWLGILMLGVLELALLVFTVLVVTVGNWTLSLLVGLLIGCVLIGLTMFFTVRSLYQPYIYINANSRTLEAGRGLTTQQIPFSGISYIRATHIKSFGHTPYDLTGEIVLGTIAAFQGFWTFGAGATNFGKTRIDIQVMLNNEQVIKLGSVSGHDNVLSRATAITQLVAKVTGAAILESSQP